MRRVARRSLLAIASQLFVTVPAFAQFRTFTACTPDLLKVCSELRLTAGPSVFEIVLRTVGALSNPTMPISVYNLVFATGADAAGIARSTMVVPRALDGATVIDASPWDVFDAGDVLFLSSLTNRGVGNCATGGDVGGFGQAALTCGESQFVSFAFTSTRTFDPALFTLLNFEAVGLTLQLPGASCGGDGAECLITESSHETPSTTVPEPSTFALLLVGLVAAVRIRRRSS